MNSETIILISFTELISCAILFENLNIPDYGYPAFQHPKDIRQSFIKNRKRNDETAKRIQLLDKYLPNNTVYVDDIAHFEIVKTHPESKKVNDIELEFRDLIAMSGLKYIYKRDTFWRTWRLVQFPEGKNVIKYRAENSVNFTNYPSSGYWIIEEKSPPCPYELFSIANDDKMCALHLDKYHDTKSNCSSVVSLSDLTSTCDNPVVTEWQIEKKFDAKVPERFPSIICGGRQFCTITTVYKISPDNIAFSIVNMTHNVIYSRIMKINKNYACVENCGIMNPYSKTISTIEKSLRINLLGSKNKREDKNYDSKLNSNSILLDSKSRRQVTAPFLSKLILGTHNKVKGTFTTKVPTCKALKLSLVQDELDEDY